MIAMASLTGVALTGCGNDSNDAAPPPPVVAAPDAPTSFTATAGENLVDLSWSPPAASVTAGAPTSYVIYVSTTDTTVATVFVPDNLLAEVPVVDGRTVYNFTDSGLPGTVDHYYVVTAKNAGGETPSLLASARPTGSPRPPTAGNNFSKAMIFADNIGISNAVIAGSWTLDPTLIDFNTGLRPLLTEMAAVTHLPYLTVPSKVDPQYFEQKSVNTWQGEWALGNAAPVNVNAKWGDNLAGSASLSSSAKIRLEMVLTTTVPTPMTTYEMKSLYGARKNEMFGTNGVVIPSTTAFVFASNAHLTIHKLDAGGNKILPAVDDQYLFDSSVPDGLNKLSAEIPVSGNFTYGYVWDPSTTGSTAGKYRITFLLDGQSQGGIGNPPNNTFMKTATNGVLVSDTEAYIDIDVK
ncbi:MAG: hypothetical protein AMJ69_12900 [Gammaproteobacteria bacterium SG8_47]|nr:MAG: hypothetical protein AMJ69_12900 [Gammaproteobacteria bacterium SG8_47]